MSKKEFSDSATKARRLRETLLSDSFRPGYHFAVSEDDGNPGDPNGAFFANGRYHLMYLYKCSEDGFRYGHMSSLDLLHWRRHSDPVAPDALDGGIFSGGAFVDDDGTAYISFWGLPQSFIEKDGDRSNCVRIAKSTDIANHYEKWEKLESTVISSPDDFGFTKNGSDDPHNWRCCADPSNIWKKDGKYYIQTGNLPLLQQFYDNPDSPAEFLGDMTELLCSEDMINWKYLHRFYSRDSSNSQTGIREDDMCPSFLPLPSSPDGGEPSGKHLQLFISHCRGAQYYIGIYDEQNDLFLPEKHGRMSWVDNTYFAPEALIDAKGRQIAWAWLTDNPTAGGDLELYGWSGVFALPRTLWLNAEGELGIAPVSEMKALRYNETDSLDSLSTDFCEISFSLPHGEAERFHLAIENAQDKNDRAEIYFSAAENALIFDTTQCKGNPRRVRETAPLTLRDGEALNVTLYLDKSVVEVFANDRQALARRVYISERRFDIDSELKLKAWEIMPTNPY